jgi:hypothetical protein
MELKKVAIGVITLGAAVVAISLVRGAAPTTVPAVMAVAAPATRASAPATQPAAKPVTASSDSSSSSRRDRGNRHSRGSRESSATPVISNSDPYAVLDTRSIFIKGNQTIAGSGPRSSGESSSGSSIFPNRQASALIFNGVILVNGEALAMVEDSNSGTVVRVHAGDSISGGRVTGITFDDLAYEASGQTKHVEIGQNLEGQAASSSGYSNSPVAGAPTTMPAGGPTPAGVTSPPGSSTSGMSQEDILAKLKARRAAESAGK